MSVPGGPADGMPHGLGEQWFPGDLRLEDLAGPTTDLTWLGTARGAVLAIGDRDLLADPVRVVLAEPTHLVVRRKLVRTRDPVAGATARRQVVVGAAVDVVGRV